MLSLYLNMYTLCLVYKVVRSSLSNITKYNIQVYFYTVKHILHDNVLCTLENSYQVYIYTRRPTCMVMISYPLAKALNLKYHSYEYYPIHFGWHPPT